VLLLPGLRIWFLEYPGSGVLTEEPDNLPEGMVLSGFPDRMTARDTQRSLAHAAGSRAVSTGLEDYYLFKASTGLSSR
jgi:hypothetical protein